MLDSTVTTQVQETLDRLNAALEEGDAQAALDAKADRVAEWNKTLAA